MKKEHVKYIDLKFKDENRTRKNQEEIMVQ